MGNGHWGIVLADVSGKGMPAALLTEAMNRHDEEYGPARLVEHFLQPDACVEGLIEQVHRFSHGSDRTDDATVVLVRSR